MSARQAPCVLVSVDKSRILHDACARKKYPSNHGMPVTVAILAQGTHWAVASSQAFFFVMHVHRWACASTRQSVCACIWASAQAYALLQSQSLSTSQHACVFFYGALLIHEPSRLSVPLCASLRLSVPLRVKLCLSVPLHGCLWLSVAVCVSLLLSVAHCRALWSAVEV